MNLSTADTTANFPDYKIIIEALDNVIDSAKIISQYLGKPINQATLKTTKQTREKIAITKGLKPVTVTGVEIKTMIKAVVGNQETVAMSKRHETMLNSALRELKDIFHLATSLSYKEVNLYIKRLRRKFHRRPRRSYK